MGLIDQLKEDHQQFLSQVSELEAILDGLKDSLSPIAQANLQKILQHLIEGLQSHGEVEKNELFTHVRDHMPEDEKWRVAMIETHDEMILDVAQNLHLLISDACASIPVERLKESGIHLIRWIKEHVVIEEEHFFPRFEGL